jgi:20S proteasome alpha/beta subunit
VTIVAGFKTYEGVVLCADTQETSGTAKRRVPKLIFHPEYQTIKMKRDPNYLAAAFCGAGDGAFVDLLVDQSWRSAQHATNLEDASNRIVATIKETYREYGQIYQPGSCPTAELLFGVRMDGDSRLFAATGPLVNEKNGYSSSGIGYYLADFLAARMYKEYLSLKACVILAAYVLFQAKEHVEGCGGDSHIAVLRNQGISGMVDIKRVEAITKFLQLADSELGDILLAAADLDTNNDKLRKEFAESLHTLETLRDRTREEIDEAAKRFLRLAALLGGPNQNEEPTDMFGLPLSPSESSGADR